MGKREILRRGFCDHFYDQYEKVSESLLRQLKSKTMLRKYRRSPLSKHRLSPIQKYFSKISRADVAASFSRLSVC